MKEKINGFPREGICRNKVWKSKSAIMNEVEIIDERIIKVIDLLEQIKSVDEMIELHQQKADEKDIMLLQYNYRRENFLKALGESLEELNIKPEGLAA